jgi:hypothetical protein
MVYESHEGASRPRWLAALLAICLLACTHDPAGERSDAGAGGPASHDGGFVSNDGGMIADDGGFTSSDAGMTGGDGGWRWPDGGVYTLADGGDPGVGHPDDGGCGASFDDVTHGCCGASYDEAFASNCGPPATTNATGTCQGLRVVRLEDTEICVYGDKGQLIGVREITDTPAYCARTSDCVFAGAVPPEFDCEHRGLGDCPLTPCTVNDAGVCIPDAGDIGDGG